MKILPVVKVWCLPADLTEETLQTVHQAIVLMFKVLSEFGIKDEKGLIVLFPRDMMGYGLGTEILIEADYFPDCGNAALQNLAGQLGKVINAFFGDAVIQSIARPVGRGEAVSILGPE